MAKLISGYDPVTESGFSEGNPQAHYDLLKNMALDHICSDFQVIPSLT